MPGKNRRPPNYAARVLARLAQARAQGRLKPGTVHMIDVRHEDGCALLAGAGPCNCNPDVGTPQRVASQEEN